MSKSMSKPLFKKGDIVRYSNEQQNLIMEERRKLLKTFTNNEIGESPTYKLRIYEDPQWNPSINQWIYLYEYGNTFTSEGSTREDYLVKF